MKTKSQLKEIAKNVLEKVTDNAYYWISDEPERFDITEEEVEIVSEYIAKYEKTMHKAIGR